MESNHRSSGCHPDVFAAGPRDRVCCIVSMTEVGVEPTTSRASHARRFACLRTRPTETETKWRVRGSHPTFQAYEARMSTGSPAVKLGNCQCDPCGDRTRVERLRTFHPAARRTGDVYMGSEGIEPLVATSLLFRQLLYRQPRGSPPEVAREGIEPSKSRRFELRRFASLRTAPSPVAQVGLEPTASLVLSQGGLPIAYRAV